MYAALTCLFINVKAFYLNKHPSRAAFLNRRVATQQRVVVDFKRVVGLVQNHYYKELFCGKKVKTSLEEGLQIMKVLRCGMWRFFIQRNGLRSNLG